MRGPLLHQMEQTRSTFFRLLTTTIVHLQPQNIWIERRKTKNRISGNTEVNFLPFIPQFLWLFFPPLLGKKKKKKEKRQQQ